VQHRVPRLFALALRYVAVWTAIGVVAYLIADCFGRLAGNDANVVQSVAVGTFAVVGICQLTALKSRCLSHCRSPLGHLMHYLGFTGRLCDFRAGTSHGWFCLGCCWARHARRPICRSGQQVDGHCRLPTQTSLSRRGRGRACPESAMARRHSRQIPHPTAMVNPRISSMQPARNDAVPLTINPLRIGTSDRDHPLRSCERV